jgi:hypothetical protein
MRLRWTGWFGRRREILLGCCVCLAGRFASLFHILTFIQF